MYSKQRYILILIVSLFATGCEKLANEPDTTTDEIKSDEGLNYWGGSYNDEGHAIVQTADGGYGVAGSQYSSGTQSNLMLVKFSSSLEFESNTSFGGGGGDSVYTNIANDIQQTKDGGYIIVGSTFNGTNGDYDVWVIKFASDLSMEWESVIAGTTAGYDDFGNSIQEMASGKYLICGTSYDGTNGDFDAMLWDITRDGATSTSLYTEVDNLTHDYGNYAQQTTDGGYIMVTTSMTISTSVSSMNLIKLDASGAALAAFSGDGILPITASDQGIYVQQLTDGNYVVVGNTQAGTGQQSNVYVNTVSSAGDPGTPITMGGAYNDKVTCVRQTTDGGFVFTGSKYNEASSDDVWVVKLTPALTAHWDYTFGGKQSDYGQSIFQTSDGGYVITGSTMSYGNQSEIILLKLESDGKVEDIIGNLNTSKGK